MVGKRCPFYSALASSAPKAVLGAASLPRRGLRPLRCCTGRSIVAAGLLSLPLEGCAGLARNSRSSKGARSKRRMIACISSAVGASTNAKPLDSCVSWLRITLTESATRFSAVSHALISSAVTHVGRLPKKNSEIHSVIRLLRWLDLWHFKGRIPLCHLDSIRPDRVQRKPWRAGLSPRGALAPLCRLLKNRRNPRQASRAPPGDALLLDPAANPAHRVKPRLPAARGPPVPPYLPRTTSTPASSDSSLAR